MEKQTILSEELAQLNPLIGNWNFKGSFKDNPDKKVEGWETYKIANEGRMVVCEGETITLWPKGKDVYKNTMDIVYDAAKRKIIGGGEWVYSLDNGTWILENDMHRFTGKLNSLTYTIIGQGESKDQTGYWKYWYDKLLTKIV